MTTSQDRIPHLTRDGESVWRLEDFEALMAAGVIPTDTITDIEDQTGTAPQVANPRLHDNLARSSRAFKAVWTYAEDYTGQFRKQNL